MYTPTRILLILAILAVPVRLESTEDDTSPDPENDQETTTEPWNFSWEEGTDEDDKTSETTTKQNYATTDRIENLTDGEAELRVARLSEQIRSVLEGYRDEGVVRLPGLPVPDPMSVPDIKKNFPGAPVHFSNNTVYGLSNFTVDHINTDIDKMQVFVALHIKRLVILGNYSMKGFISKSSGPYNITLLDVEASGAAEIEKDAEGNLQATDSEMDMTFTDAKVDLQNIGVVGNFFQGVVASAGPALFDAIKPSILKEVNTKIREQVNARIKTIGDKFVVPDDSISPIDKAVAEGRRYVRENGYDPYKLNETSLDAAPFKITISEFVVSGLSRFYRVGDVGLSMDKGNIQATIHLATKRLYGFCQWNISFSDFFKRNGISHFTVKQLQVRAKVNQSLDVKQPPKLVDLDIFLGPIRAQMDKTENFNSVIEFVVNAMPAIIRHIIVDTLEIPIKMKVQEILDKVDVESLLEETLPQLDNMGL